MRKFSTRVILVRPGITLLETMVVIAIILVLIAITLPAIQKARDAAMRSGCASKLRQLTIAVHGYSDTNGALPQGCSYPFLPANLPYYYQPGISWQTNILPYIEQSTAWNMAWDAHQIDPLGHSPEHQQVRNIAISMFLCPAENRRQGGYGGDETWTLTSYQGVAGTGLHSDDGLFHINYLVRFEDITDGTSSTLMIGERPPGPKGTSGGWYSMEGDCLCPLSQILAAGFSTPPPTMGVGCRQGIGFRPGNLDDYCSVAYYWSLHPGGGNFAFADGSVRFMSYSQSEIVPLLATRADGEVVSWD